MPATRIRYVVLLPSLALTLGCGGGDSATQGDGGPVPALITVDGSSTVFPIAEAVAEEFGKANPGSRPPTVWPSELYIM